MSAATPTRSSERSRQPSAKVIAASASASLASPVKHTPPAKAKSSSTPPGAPKKQRSAAPEPSSC